ncbi:cupin domain-containing protein [Gaiella sp.]|uniref:cupin domain-containing protein n=1 Tax=Gaiella sp. TaxID=2663207 RepID=UPI003263B43C
MDEARLDDTGSGVAPATEGWFVVNVRDAEWKTHDVFGSGCVFESDVNRFPQLGINISVLEPGKANCLYHSESLQEAFLVLSGQCLLLVNEEERLLGPWDFFHCPAGVEHVFVGAGDGPCVVLMLGARSEHEKLLYPVSDLAARYGASAEAETPEPRVAYAAFERPLPGRPTYWDQLPWA